MKIRLVGSRMSCWVTAAGSKSVCRDCAEGLLALWNPLVRSRRLGGCWWYWDGLFIDPPATLAAPNIAHFDGQQEQDGGAETARRAGMTDQQELTPCLLGREEYDGARFCHEHMGFLEAGREQHFCDRSPLMNQVSASVKG